MNSFIPWVGGKGKLLWIINKLMPDRYTRFIDVFGGSGTVTMCRPAAPQPDQENRICGAWPVPHLA